MRGCGGGAAEVAPGVAGRCLQRARSHKSYSSSGQTGSEVFPLAMSASKCWPNPLHLGGSEDPSLPGTTTGAVGRTGILSFSAIAESVESQSLRPGSHTEDIPPGIHPQCSTH